MSTVPPDLLRALRRRALVVLAAGGLASVVAVLLDPGRFLQSWLLAFLFWLAFPLGAFGVAQLHHMTGGGWGRPVRGLLEGTARTLPLMALAFVPIALGLEELYPWARPDAVEHDPVLQHKRPWLNAPFFLGRAAGFLLLWILLAHLQERTSRRREQDPDPRLKYRQSTLAGPAFALYGVTMTFAAFDWAMSLEPHWFSSIYGLVFLVGQGLCAFAFAVVVSTALARREVTGPDADQVHDVAKLLFATVLLWAYVGYSQFLLIWSGNLREEVPWYLARSEGGWLWIALALIALHFALPFLLLLSRRVKRDARKLARIALLLLVLRWVDLAWHVLPAFHPGELALGWTDLAATAALGGLWLTALTFALDGRPLAAPPEPAPAASLSHESP